MKFTILALLGATAAIKLTHKTSLKAAPTTAEAIEAAFTMFDADSSAGLDLTEFTKFIKSDADLKDLPADKISQIFNVIAKGDVNTISKDEALAW